MPKGTNTKMNFETQAIPHLDTLYRIALWMLVDIDNAQDLVRETFSDAHSRWSQEETMSDIRIKLCKTLINIFNKKYEPRYESQLASNVYDDIDSESLTGFIDQGLRNDQAKNVLQRIACDDLKGIILKLPDDMKLPFILSRLERFGYRDVATIIGISLEMVRSRLLAASKIITMELFLMAQTRSTSRRVLVAQPA